VVSLGYFAWRRPGGGRFRFGGLGNEEGSSGCRSEPRCRGILWDSGRASGAVRVGENLAGRECGAAGGPGEGQDREWLTGEGGGFGGIVGNENGFIRALSAGESGALNAGGMVSEAGAEHVSARYVYDVRSRNFRDSTTGKFVAQSELPYPKNGGFVWKERLS